MKEYTDHLDALRDEFQSQVQALGSKIRAEVVIPACKKHRLTFTSGMGTFFFSRNGRDYTSAYQINCPKLRQTLLPILELLNTDVSYNDCIGYYVGDVK